MRLLAVILLVLSFACSENKKGDVEPARETESAINETTDKTVKQDSAEIYTVNGTVKSVPPNGKFIIIDHETIPGFMHAMEMPFYVESPEVVKGIKPDDRIRFTFRAKNAKMTVTKIETLK